MPQVRGASQEGMDQAAQDVRNSTEWQKQFANQALGSNGIVNQNAMYGQQQQLADQLSQQAQGQGPNPAQAALNQATGQNIAAQSAMAAGQRGASQNVGLMSRNIGQQGAATQQQSIGQSAIMQAQQQLAAQQQLGQQQQMMQGVNAQQFGQAQQANQQYGQMGLSNQGQLIQQQQGAEIANQGAKQSQNRQAGQMVGSLIGAAGQAVAPMAQGGEVQPSPGPISPETAQSFADGMNKAFGFSQDPKPKEGPKSKFGQSIKMRSGGVVPGQAKVNGDSYANDTVPILASPGEIVVPRSAAQSPDKAAAFARAVAMKSGKGK